MKTTFITDINKIKFEVNTEVARLAFAGELDEKANEIPYKLIPGRTPHYRCCVYREREIIRERVQLAMGRSAMSGQKNKNIVQVIEAACEGCPINRFNVTNNCQMCMAKNVLAHVILAPSSLKAAMPSLTIRNVKSAVSVQRLVLTMPLPT